MLVIHVVYLNSRENVRTFGTYMRQMLVIDIFERGFRVLWEIVARIAAFYLATETYGRTGILRPKEYNIDHIGRASNCSQMGHHLVSMPYEEPLSRPNRRDSRGCRIFWGDPVFSTYPRDYGWLYFEPVKKIYLFHSAWMTIWILLHA